jgi:hypothetical protein
VAAPSAPEPLAAPAVAAAPSASEPLAAPAVAAAPSASEPPAAPAPHGAAVSTAARAPDDTADPTPLPIRLAVVADDAGEVVPPGWVEREIAEANRLLSPHGITVVLVERVALPGRYAALENAADRDALVAERTRGWINVFVVRSLRDVDVPTRHILGVRWRLLRDVRKDYVILASIASPTTLAHELGHLLGAEHVPGKSFIMSWSAQPYHLPVADPIARVVATYRFHPRNLESIRAHVRARFTARGLLLPDPCIRRMQAIDRCWGL